MTGATPQPSVPSTTTATDGPWRALSSRVIWVDLTRSGLSLLPGVIAVYIVGIEPSLGTLWPFLLIAVVGVTGAVADVVRWLFTRYRVTETEIERRTGVLVRRHRSVPLDRIRSVDTHAVLRHRIARLRVLTIGAGQQASAGEAAFVLDALTRDDAEQLRRLLIREQIAAAAPVSAVRAAAAESAPDAGHDEPPQEIEVLATLRPWWVVYNLFSIWSFLTGAGLLWGAYWLASTVGINLVAVAERLIDWDRVGRLGTVVIALVGGGAIGAMGMGVNFLTSNWGFTLSRTRSEDSSYLRTRRGLFSTREVNRDERRMRGVSIGEPLLWRWMGMADTNVITTGLGLWDSAQPTAILPRGPRSVALEVAARALGGSPPLDRPLPRHPRAALRRRLWWATLLAVGGVGFVALPVATGAAPTWVLWTAIGLWPLALCAAVVAYRALGHAICGDYLIVRAGLMSRTTSALRRDAVSTIAVRQSVLQQRLGLSTVSAMTAAGWSAYEAPDVAAEEAVSLAARAAPGLVDEFLHSETAARTT